MFSTITQIIVNSAGGRPKITPHFLKLPTGQYNSKDIDARWRQPLYMYRGVFKTTRLLLSFKYSLV